MKPRWLVVNVLLAAISASANKINHSKLYDFDNPSLVAEVSGGVFAIIVMCGIFLPLLATFGAYMFDDKDRSITKANPIFNFLFIEWK